MRRRRSTTAGLPAAALALALVTGCGVPALDAVPGASGSAPVSGQRGGNLPRGTVGPSQFPGSPERLPACRIDDVATTRGSLGDWATTIVDTSWALPEGYVPPGLVPVTRAGIAGAGRIRKLVIADLAALGDAAAV